MSFLNLDDLSVDADGTYIIQVGGTRRRGNYLSSGPGATVGSDEPTISPEAREDRIERRRLALDHRFRP
jgi:hypothetical protein